MGQCGNGKTHFCGSDALAALVRRLITADHSSMRLSVRSLASLASSSASSLAMTWRFEGSVSVLNKSR